MKTLNTITRLNINYASGNLGKSAIASLLELFILFYFTEILSISPSLAGSIILISLIWDGITDPIIGIYADRFREKFNTIKPFFLLGAPITAVAIIAIFYATEISQQYRSLYAICTLLIFRTAYTFVDIPHNGLMTFITKDSKQRTNIASLRIFFSALGRLLVTLTSIYVLSDTEGNLIASRFFEVTLFFALFFVMVIYNCAFKTQGIKITDTGNIQSNGTEKFNFFAIWQTLKNNRPLVVVFLLTAITSLTTHVIGSSYLYFSKYHLEDESIGATALTIMAASQAISLLFWSKLSNKQSSKRIASQQANFLLFIAMVISVVFLNSSYSLFLVATLTGFAIGGIYMLNWSMLPEAIDFGQQNNKQQYAFSIFGLYTLTNKICFGLSQAYIGWVLTYFGYNVETQNGAENIEKITTTILFAPLIGTALCIYVLRHYTIKQSAIDNKL